MLLYCGGIDLIKKVLLKRRHNAHCSGTHHGFILKFTCLSGSFLDPSDKMAALNLPV